MLRNYTTLKQLKHFKLSLFDDVYSFLLKYMAKGKNKYMCVKMVSGWIFFVPMTAVFTALMYRCVFSLHCAYDFLKKKECQFVIIREPKKEGTNREGPVERPSSTQRIC